jgi:hypothetical protein
MMSDTATTDLAAGRFGALPSWATTPYQIGMAPSAYPTPGVNAGIGAPGYAGNPLPGQGGGGGLPGGGAGASGGILGGAGSGGPQLAPNAGNLVGPGLPPWVANTPFGQALMAQGIGLGNRPITHQTPGFAAMPQAWTGRAPPPPTPPAQTPLARVPLAQTPAAPRSSLPNLGPAMGYVPPRPVVGLLPTLAGALPPAQRFAAALAAARARAAAVR